MAKNKMSTVLLLPHTYSADPVTVSCFQKIQVKLRGKRSNDPLEI
jgi:hypothetical protein